MLWEYLCKLPLKTGGTGAACRCFLAVCIYVGAVPEVRLCQGLGYASPARWLDLFASHRVVVFLRSVAAGEEFLLSSSNHEQ